MRHEGHPEYVAKIIRIVTRIRAAVGRYRFGRPAAVVVALYLAVVAVAAVFAVVSGEVSALSVAATATTWARLMRGAWVVPLLAGICWLNAWALWQVLRGPALPRAEGLPRDVVRLRRLLYAGVAGDLVLWGLVEELSGIVEYVASLALWTATLILLARVVSGVSARFRAITLALGLIGTLTPTLLLFLDTPGFRVFGLPTLANLGWTVMTLIGQRRDGRWSGATIGVGRIALASSPAFPVLVLVFQGDWLLFDGSVLVVNALDVFTTVWLARTAHELARPADMPAAETTPRSATGRGPRLLVAVALALPLVVVGAEEGARFGFTGLDEGCRERIRPYTDTRPQDRRRSFLCLARDDHHTGVAIFPGNLPEQRVLALGEELCAVSGAEERQRCSGERAGRRPRTSSATPWSSCAPASSPGNGRTRCGNRRAGRPSRSGNWPRGKRRRTPGAPHGQGVRRRPAAPAQGLGQGGRGGPPQPQRPHGRTAVP